MKIVAPVNNKGGVGKTTVSRMLAEYYAIVEKKRVLAIDLDPQCNYSNRFLRMEIDPTESEGKLPPIHPNYDPNDPEDEAWDGRSSIADIFFGKPVFPYPTDIPNLELLPGNSSKLLLAEAVRRSEVLEKVYNQLFAFLDAKEVKESYDIVIIDTPPSKGPLTISVVRAATDIVIPSIMEPQPIEGIYGMLQLWKQELLRRANTASLNLIGILPNMYNSSSNLHKAFLDELTDNPAISEYMIPAKIGRRMVFAEVDAEGAKPPSIFSLPDKNVAKQEVLMACKLISERMSSYG